MVVKAAPEKVRAIGRREWKGERMSEPKPCEQELCLGRGGNWGRGGEQSLMVCTPGVLYQGLMVVVVLLAVRTRGKVCVRVKIVKSKIEPTLLLFFAKAKRGAISSVEAGKRVYFVQLDIFALVDGPKLAIRP